MNWDHAAISEIFDFMQWLHVYSDQENFDDQAKQFIYSTFNQLKTYWITSNNLRSLTRVGTAQITVPYILAQDIGSLNLKYGKIFQEYK